MTGAKSMSWAVVTRTCASGGLTASSLQPPTRPRAASRPTRLNGRIAISLAAMLAVSAQWRMPTIKRLSFIGLEYAFAPAKAYGMSRGGGHRRQGGLVEVETDQGVKGIGEAFGNPLVTREYFRMVEPLFVVQSVFDFHPVDAP